MRAAVLDESGLSVREWPEPEPGPGEALISLTKVGICGSDTHFVIDGSAKTAFMPIVLGHEPCGYVEALGPDTEGPAIGTRVAIVPLITCGECDRCRNGRAVLCKSRLCIGADTHGAWADLCTVPVSQLIEAPEGMSDELVAVATDSVATAYHAVATQGRVHEGSRVAVWGTGGLGLSAVGIAAALGASDVVAVDLARGGPLVGDGVRRDGRLPPGRRPRGDHRARRSRHGAGVRRQVRHGRGRRPLASTTAAAPSSSASASSPPRPAAS